MLGEGNDALPALVGAGTRHTNRAQNNKGKAPFPVFARLSSPLFISSSQVHEDRGTQSVSLLTKGEEAAGDGIGG